MKKGARGLFEVYVDAGTLYSNRIEGGRLPTNEEVIERLRKYQESRQGGEATGAGAGSSGTATGCG
jgi:hypothetical protein